MCAHIRVVTVFCTTLSFLCLTVDVHWVWHCHMLSPTKYIADLTHSPLGRPINHEPRSQPLLESLRTHTQKLWTEHFPQEPFEIHDRIHPNLEHPTSDESKVTGEGEEKDDKLFKFSYDVVAAAERQMVFYYQVSLPHYRQDWFLAEALERYKQYFALKKKFPERFLVPCYDMDIVWHTHQVT